MLVGAGPGLCQLRRITLPRTQLNKGKRKGRGGRPPSGLVLHEPIEDRYEPLGSLDVG
jgi:hypothetical protein